MKVLIIPEDQTQDGYIAKPVIEALLNDEGIPARVDVLPEPRLRGAGDALDPELVREIVDEYPMIDLFVLVVDRDCDRQGHEAKAAAREQEHAGRLVACVAIQELEVWLLALHKDKLDARWPEIRNECDPKERWAEPLLKRIGTSGPGGGRKKAMQALKGQLQSLVSLCDELQQLKGKLAVARNKNA